MVKVVGKKQIKAETRAALTYEETQKLRSFIYSLEYNEEEKRRIAAREKEIFAEAKAAKFDVAALKEAFAAIKKKNRDRAASQTTSDIYVSALETF